MTPDPEFENVQACLQDEGQRMAFAGMRKALLFRGLVDICEMPGEEEHSVSVRNYAERPLVIENWGGGVFFVSMPRSMAIARDIDFSVFMQTARGPW